MAVDPQAKLKAFQPKHKFFVGIDSDGCAFDTMEIKHKECFIPNIIEHWDLQAVSKYAREAGEFVNLYSKWRGINRWPALLMVFDLLDERPEVKARGVKMPAVDVLRDWVKHETKLGNPVLQEVVERTKDPIMAKALTWSKTVNATIERMVHGVPPFPLVRESLKKLEQVADMVVVSQTPGEALEREWEEHDIARHAAIIAGQELGSKSEHLAMTAKDKYPSVNILMIGDAPGDYKAARANNALFFPINPGEEEKSWELFYREACDRFLQGTYAGDYEASLIKQFDARLPEAPPWKR